MYTCTMCGLKKSQLGSNPDFEFRSRRRQAEEAYIEGISDWCSKCEALRFFFKSDDGKESPQYLEEQPKRKLANYMLEATAMGCQDNRQHRPKGKKDGQDRKRKTQRDLRHEARKVMRQELLAGLPSQLPRGSLWERKLRSYSEDRDRPSRRVQSTAERRSKSVVNESFHQSRLDKQQAERRSCLAKDISKLGLKPDKRVHLGDSNVIEENGLLNSLLDQMEDHDTDEDSRGPISFKSKLPIGKLQEMELLNPWQEEVQRRTNQLLASSAKKELKAARERIMDFSLPKTLDYDKKRSFNGPIGVTKRLTVDEVARDMKKMEREEFKDHLHNKLVEKKNLVGEWERIRHRVEDECNRVKAELIELRRQRDIEMERKPKVSHEGGIERQRGGAQFGPTYSDKEQTNDPEDIKSDHEKTIGDALDEKLENMLDTLHENSQKVESSVDNVEKNLLFEPSAPLESQTEFEESEKQTDINADDSVDEMTEFSKHQEEPLHPVTCEKSELSTMKPKRLLSKLHMLVSTVQRARFRGFPEDPQQLLQNLTPKELMDRRDPPPAQFSTLPCSPNELISLLSLKREVLQPHMARPLKVCRSPIFCPDADCRRMFFISDFNDHLTHEHPSLAMERITPCKAKTFFLDTRVTLLNKAKCNMVYFVKDKFIDKNTEKYPDLLPVLVMTARLHAPDFFTSNNPAKPRSTARASGSDQEIFLIWLTSIRPDDVKIIGTISVWPTSSRPIVEYLMVQTNEVYNIRSAQKLKTIYNSNRVMALPGNFVNRMTDGGKHLLAVQVLIH
ncbi:uncharacterized protein LOC115769543 [Drosophila novamexicana]|uniref:uncharacterized protein LOC115769543 n=1 Tax=Drosophila novamexicana TaxID=47314 RepID=UPI0011E5FEEF|nr:uncharacterized protein LOC115769543 [Drosophila novamexicana]